MMRFGLIGCGTHARWAVGPAFQQASRVELRAVADVSAEHLEEFPWPRPDLRRYLDYREMIANEGLDAVYVATPCEAHVEPTLAALARGLHVVTEKPMALSAADAERMVTAATAADRQLIVDFENRYSPVHRAISEWVRAGYLGRVGAVHMNEFWDGHKVTGPLAERRRRFTDASGCLDCGIHHLDLARYYCGGGHWLDVHATGVWFGEAVRFPPHIAIQARLDHGVLVTLNASFAYTAYIEPRDLHDSIVIVGTDGVIDFRRDWADGTDTVRLTSARLTEARQFGTHGHAAVIPQLLDDLAAVVLDGAARPPALATGTDGHMAQVIVDAANAQAVQRGDAGPAMDR
jgi:predicted dehydrogenase